MERRTGSGGSRRRCWSAPSCSPARSTCWRSASPSALGGVAALARRERRRCSSPWPACWASSARSPRIAGECGAGDAAAAAVARRRPAGAGAELEAPTAPRASPIAARTWDAELATPRRAARRDHVHRRHARLDARCSPTAAAERRALRIPRTGGPTMWIGSSHRHAGTVRRRAHRRRQGDPRRAAAARAGSSSGSGASTPCCSPASTS